MRRIIAAIGDSIGLGPNNAGPDIIYPNADRLFIQPQAFNLAENPTFPTCVADHSPMGIIPVATPVWRGPPGPGGFGLSCCDRLLTLRDVSDLRYGFVPCAIPGTGSDVWLCDFRATLPFGSVVRRIKKAMDWAGTDCDVEAVLISLGTNNAAALDDNHNKRMSLIVRDLRAALDRPDLLVIVLNLGPIPVWDASGYFGNWVSIQIGHNNLASSDIGVVQTADFPTWPANVHFSAQTHVLIGQRVARYIAALRP